MKIGCEKCGHTGWVPGAIGFSWPCECTTPAQLEADMKQIVAREAPEPPVAESVRSGTGVLDAYGTELFVGDVARLVSDHSIVYGVERTHRDKYSVWVRRIDGSLGPGWIPGDELHVRLALDARGQGLYVGDHVCLDKYPDVTYSVAGVKRNANPDEGTALQLNDGWEYAKNLRKIQ